MEVYFYCNYNNSSRGFLLTKLCRDGLKSVTLFNSQNKGELLVDRFFSYDCFRILWLEIPKNNTHFFKPETENIFFGLRGLNGTISGKKGYLNIAFLADNNEKEEMENLVRGILCDISCFSDRVFNALSAGGKDSYELDTEKFTAIIDSAVNNEYTYLPFNIKTTCRTLRDLLRFAVYVGAWEDAYPNLESDAIWKIRPKQAINEKNYTQLFNL